MPNFINRLVKYRQIWSWLKRVLGLVLKILVILEKIFNLFKQYPF